MSSLSETYLLLAPEFGGTKFGPFSGMEIRLGSDPSRNDVVLPEALGVLPEHVRVLSQGNDSFIVAPTERTAGVYVWRAGQRAKQILTPMAVTGGADTFTADAFSLVTADGPKFYIVREEVKKAAGEMGNSIAKAKKRLSSGSILEEIKRVGIVWLVTTELGKMGRVLYTFFRSGAFLHPRYVVGYGLTMIGWVFAGGTACMAFNIASNKGVAEAETDRCQQRLDLCSGTKPGVNSDVTSLHSLTARILGDPIWSTTLKEDE